MATLRMVEDGHHAPPANLNHMLVLDLEPAMNQQNFNEIRMSN
jgi:hypothetical protein